MKPTLKTILESFDEKFDTLVWNGVPDSIRARELTTFISEQIRQVIESCPCEKMEYYNDMFEEKQKKTDRMFIDYVAVDGFNSHCAEIKKWKDLINK